MRATINLTEGSVITNLTVPFGAAFPLDANEGELYTLTSGNTGLYLYHSSQWIKLESSAIILVDASEGPVNQVLPAASSVDGHTIIVKRIDNSANGCTVSATSGTIDTASSIPLYYLEALTCKSHNGQWYVI
jgi:hypothetical protein